MDFSVIKKHVVIALFSDDELMEKFVLKGGSAIDMFYPNPSVRSSVDIDLSMPKDFKPDELERVGEKIERRLKEEFYGLGYEIIELKFGPRPKTRHEGLPEFWGGYLLEFKVVTRENYSNFQRTGNIEGLRRTAEIVGKRQKRTFKVEISKFEYSAGKRDFELEGTRVYVYPPELIVAEKLRAICQQMIGYKYIGKSRRPRARDFYDIWYLCENEKRFRWSTKKFVTLQPNGGTLDLPK